MLGVVELVCALVVVWLGFKLRTSGARAMLDVLGTHSLWDPRPRESAAPKSGGAAAAGAQESGAVLRRLMANQRQERRATAKSATQEVRDRSLFKMKDSSWDLLQESKQRPFMGLSCATCTPDSRAFGVDAASKHTNLRNILQEQHTVDSGFLARTFKHLAQVYNVRKFQYPRINETVLTDERLQQAIKMTAKDQCNQHGETSQEALNKLVRQHELRARRILNEMRSKLSDFLLRLTAWVLLKVLPCFLTSVVVHPAQVEMLQRAGRSGLPLIFMPLHRSHLDYILVTFILLNIDVKAPMVAAGDNLNIPVFGRLLRGLGAFFIKRRMDPVSGRRDTVYRAVLHTYMMQCLRAGHNLEFFAEGGRTRTGKACLPKGGLLSVIVDAYFDRTVEDALLVPVSLNYERLVDGNFTREQMGQPKEMESFTSALRGIWHTLTSNYGSARIDFNQPFSLRDMIKSFQQSARLRNPLAALEAEFEEQNEHNSQQSRKPGKRTLHSTPSSSSLYGTDVVVEEHRQLVESIARHIIHDCCQSTAVMSTNIVAFLLLSEFREGATLESLSRALDRTRTELTEAGRDCGFSGEAVDVISHAADVLGPGLVKREKKTIGEREVTVVRPIIMLPNVIELAYYSNVLLTHYVMDSAVASAILSLLYFDPVHRRSENPKNPVVTHDDILSRTLMCCEVLQFEFIFTKGCESLEDVVNLKVDDLHTSEILRTKQVLMTEEEQWGHRYARQLEDEDSEDGEMSERTVEYEVNIDDASALKNLQLSNSLLRPLLDAYTVTAMALRFLVDREVPERDFMKQVLAEIQTLLDHQMIKYPESMSTDAIKNALKFFERRGVLECHTQDRIKLYYLSQKYDNLESLVPVCQWITRFTDYNSTLEEPVIASP